MIEVVFSAAGTIILAFAAFCVRIEHRVTKMETKLDLLLKKNGVDPNGDKKKEG